MPGRLLRAAEEGAELTQGLGHRLHDQRRRRGPGEQAATGVRSVTSASAAVRSPTAMTAMARNVAKMV